ncbi:unnamed protein product, partial [Didymodactylos carnosus]
ATRPQHIKKRESVSSTASFAHIFAVCHLFGDIEYQFRDESDDESLILNSQEQTLNSQSNARYYTFNKTADLYEQRKKLTEQHSRNFHAKVLQLFPRYCTGFQIFKNVIRVLSVVEQYAIFEDGHNEFRQIDENFIIQAQLAIKRLFLDDKIERNEQKMPILYIEFDTCFALWSYYEHIFKVSLKLFDLNPMSTSMKGSTNVLSTQQANARIILLSPYNVFSRTAFTGKNPKNLTVNGPFHHQDHKFDEGIKELERSKLIKTDKWLKKTRISYFKRQIPADPQEAAEFEENLNNYNVTLAEYSKIYESSSYPPNSELSLKFVTHLACDRKYIREYHKYEDDPEMRLQIGILITDGKIRTTNVDGEIQYELDPDYDLINHHTKSLLPTSAQAQLSSFVNIAQSTTMIEDVLTSPIMNAVTANKQPTETTTSVRQAHLQNEDIELVEIVDDTCSNQAVMIDSSKTKFGQLIQMAFETIESAAAANNQERNNPNKAR